MHETGCSGLVHWDDPEGWDRGWGGGSGWETHGLFVSMYGKNHHNIVISLQLNKFFFKEKYQVEILNVIMSYYRGYGILVPQPRIEPRLLAVNVPRVLTTGLPREFPDWYFLSYIELTHSFCFKRVLFYLLLFN